MNFDNVKKYYIKIINFPLSLTKNYLSKNIYKKSVDFDFYRQPFSLIFLKIFLGIIIISVIYPYHKNLGFILIKIFNFFKLSEIFSFKMPKRELFVKLSRYLFLIIIAYHFSIFLYNKLASLFSYLFIDDVQIKVVYFKNTLIFKKIYFFNLNEIQEVVYKENALFRYLKIGTIELRHRTGDKTVIKHIYKSGEIVSKINAIKHEAANQD